MRIRSVENGRGEHFAFTGLRQFLQREAVAQRGFLRERVGGDDVRVRARWRGGAAVAGKAEIVFALYERVRQIDGCVLR